MRKILLSASFFVMTPLLLFISIIYFLFLSYNQKSKNGFLSIYSAHRVAFAALPTLENVVADKIIEQDARVEIVRQFFERYKSPLEPYAQDIVDAANLYNLDFRLIPAIAMQESNLCKKAPVNSYNCWGFGIYGKKMTTFNDYKQAIDIISKTLSKHYKNVGLDTPEEIMSKYTPSNNGSWAYSVNYFMNLLK